MPESADRLRSTRSAIAERQRLFRRVCQLSPSKLVHAVTCTCQPRRTQLVESSPDTSEAEPCRSTPGPPLSNPCPSIRKCFNFFRYKADVFFSWVSWLVWSILVRTPPPPLKALVTIGLLDK
ncbi:unnamed protein product, partial [Ectocarpus sp. 4 AP-2014]